MHNSCEVDCYSGRNPLICVAFRLSFRQRKWNAHSRKKIGLSRKSRKCVHQRMAVNGIGCSVRAYRMCAQRGWRFDARYIYCTSRLESWQDEAARKLLNFFLSTLPCPIDCLHFAATVGFY